MSERHTAIVITGPTASGKSALAVSVALRLDTEVVGADSRQVYRGIPVATAVPGEEERRGVRHHLVETLELTEPYSAARYERDALACLEDIFSRRSEAVVCGGSMMYVDALCHGIDDLPDVPAEIREAVYAQWRRQGDAAMRLRLLGLDPDYYARVDLDNMKRVVHAVELSLAAGRPYSTLLGAARVRRPFRIRKFAVALEREELYRRIDLRVDEMVERGLVEEVERVAPLRALNSLNTVGVKEILGYLDGKATLAEAVAAIKRNTRVYARKQLTWLRRDPDIIWVEAPTAEEGASRILLRVKGEG